MEDLKATERSPRELEILHEMGRSLLGTIEVDEQMPLALNLAMEALEADRGSLMLWNPETDLLEVSHSKGLPSSAAHRTVALGDGIAGWVAAHKEAVVLHGGVDDPRFKGIDPKLGSALSIPMLVSDDLLGVLNVVRQSGGRFSASDLTLAQSLADLAAVGIEKSRMHAALKEREARVSELLGEVIGAYESERRRIAADIHDGFLQDLSAYFLKGEAVKNMLRKGDVDAASEAVGEMQQMVKAEIDEVRNYIFEMRPTSLDEVGLGPTLQALVDRTAQSADIKGIFTDEVGRDRLPEPIEAILYRTAQEALRNVVKHADASQFELVLRKTNGNVVMVVIDDGVGLDDSSQNREKSYGIAMMRERVSLAGGRLSVGEASPKGTLVKAVIPV